MSTIQDAIHGLTNDLTHAIVW